MKKLVSVLCAAGMFFGLVSIIQAENPDPAGLCEIIPGECYLDGLISPPHKAIDGMDGFEVPLVASWIPVEVNEGTQYHGDAKFVVSNFEIGEGERIKSYTLDIALIEMILVFRNKRDTTFLSIHVKKVQASVSRLL